MRREYVDRRRRAHPLFKLLILMIAIAAGLWHGLIPLRYVPYSAVDIAEPGSWFLDLRLAALKSDRPQCGQVLKPPFIDAHVVTDVPYDNGCGWKNAVGFSRSGGARIAIDKLTCDMAAAFTMWMAHEVQEAAAEHLKSTVSSVQHMGVYACRNVQGSKAFTAFRSQHARANAIDVAAFVLADGRTVSVSKHWKSDGAEAKFLRAIHQRSCRYFRVALGPDYNAAHYNHFHFDRGAFRRCG